MFGLGYVSAYCSRYVPAIFRIYMAPDERDIVEDMYRGMYRVMDPGGSNMRPHTNS